MSFISCCQESSYVQRRRATVITEESATFLGNIDPARATQEEFFLRIVNEKADSRDVSTTPFFSILRKTCEASAELSFFLLSLVCVWNKELSEVWGKIWAQFLHMARRASWKLVDNFVDLTWFTEMLVCKRVQSAIQPTNLETQIEVWCKDPLRN